MSVGFVVAALAAGLVIFIVCSCLTWAIEALALVLEYCVPFIAAFIATWVVSEAPDDAMEGIAVIAYGIALAVSIMSALTVHVYARLRALSSDINRIEMR